MLKESPVGPPIDRSQRHGSPVLLLLVTLVVVGAVLSLVLLEEQRADEADYRCVIGA